MLQDRPAHFTFDGTWNGILMLCHNATLFWIYEEEFSKEPTKEQFLQLGQVGLPAIIDRMLPMGRRLNKPASGPVTLTPGTVIVFVRDGHAVHSCIAMQHNLIGGYNQVGWFGRAGASTEFSTHSTSEIRWYDAHQVIGSHNSLCSLMEIPEDIARAVLRQAAQE